MFNLNISQLFNILTYGFEPYKAGAVGHYVDSTGAYQVVAMSAGLRVERKNANNDSTDVSGFISGINPANDLIFQGSDGHVAILREDSTRLLVEAIPMEADPRYYFLYEKEKGVGLRKAELVPELYYGNVKNLNNEEWSLTFE